MTLFSKVTQSVNPQRLPDTAPALIGNPSPHPWLAATGAHTLNESVSVAELVRVAQVNAFTANEYCLL